MKNRHYLLIICTVALCITVVQSAAQGQKKKKKNEILHSNSLKYKKEKNPNIRKFIGDVAFKHNEFTMYCDSAYSYLNINKIDAFSNVHIKKGDSLNLFGDFLSYNGDKSFGKIRNNVKLDDQKAQLYTDSLDFNSNNNYAHYFNGG